MSSLRTRTGNLEGTEDSLESFLFLCVKEKFIFSELPEDCSDRTREVLDFDLLPLLDLHSTVIFLDSMEESDKDFTDEAEVALLLFLEVFLCNDVAFDRFFSNG